MRPPADLLPDRVDHLRVTVTEEQRAVPHPVVDVLVAVDVPLAAAAGALDVDGKRQVMADVVGHAAGDGLPRALGQGRGLRMLRPILFDDRHRLIIPRERGEASVRVRAAAWSNSTMPAW